MKNLKTKLTAIALSSLMTVSTVGAVTASAAVPTTADTSRTIYFINNKEWSDVYDYTWGTGSDNVAFPGSPMDMVGTTTVLGDSYDVYSTTVDTNSKILFDEGKTEHGQQSNDLDLTKTSANCFCLDSNNKIEVVTNFQTDKIDFNTTATPRMAATESNNRNCYKSNGNNILFINLTEFGTIGVGNVNPIVNLTNLNGTTVELKAVPQKNANGEIGGMYYVQVPQGNYIHADVMVKACSYKTDITDTTDSIKISSNKAVACQRVFFNNDLSTKNWSEQVVCAYAWYNIVENGEVVGSVSETSFNNAKHMTYYQNVCDGKINQYFYDVPLTYDNIIFFTKTYGTDNVTAQTDDIKLNYTTNTESGIVMDGYAPVRNNGTLETKINSNGQLVTVVSLFNKQVVMNTSEVLIKPTR